jgi:hypothetical protein
MFTFYFRELRALKRCSNCTSLSMETHILTKKTFLGSAAIVC